MVNQIRAACKLGIVALALLPVVGACTLDTDVSAPSAVAYYSGGDQTAAVNTTLPTSLGVIVVNQFGEPVGGVNVTWVIVSGGGALGSATSQTSAGGIAVVNYTTGSTAGSVTITATVKGVPPLTFHETVS